MKIINFKKQSLLNIGLLCATVLILASCNKALPDATPILYPDTNPSATTIGDEINSNPIKLASTSTYSSTIKFSAFMIFACLIFLL